MNKKAAAPTILLIVLIIASLIFAGGGFYLFQQEHTKNVTLQEQLDEVKTQQKITAKQLDESKKSVMDLQLKVQEANDKINSLSAELDLEKKSRQEAEAKLSQISTDLDEQKALRSDLEQKLALAQDDGKRTQAQLNALEVQKSELESKVRTLEEKTESIELGKIVVAPEATGATKTASAVKAPTKASPVKRGAALPVSSYPGEILAVDNSYNFAVISMGAKDGVMQDQIFGVYRNGKFIGDVKIEKVNDAMAATGFTSPDQKNKFKVGDKVAPKM